MRAHVGLVLFTVLSGCASRESVPSLDEKLAQDLVGAWCNSNDGGKTCWAFDEFNSSGHFQACGKTEDELVGFAGGGRFTVNGQRMCYVLDTATPNFWLQAGSRYCTDILAIGPERHRYRDIDTKQEFELLRVAPSRKQCPPSQ
jgi:hypothetical protein